MKFVVILVLTVNVSMGQANDEFLADFLLEDELTTENLINRYSTFDFSNLWTSISNHRVLGIIGSEHERIKIKLRTCQKQPARPNEYLITGKSWVKGNICDFTGTIMVRKIHEVKTLHFGVDNEYQDKGIKAQGLLIASYEFRENSLQKHSGAFTGQLFSKWYLASNNQIEYDDISSVADGYMNNAFIGIWKSYATGKQKLCNWGDDRVPNCNADFDSGAGEFYPSDPYHSRGWENYVKAWAQGDKQAQNEELNEWWK